MFIMIVLLLLHLRQSLLLVNLFVLCPNAKITLNFTLDHKETVYLVQTSQNTTHERPKHMFANILIIIFLLCSFYVDRHNYILCWLRSSTPP